MRLTRATDYAVRVLVLLAAREPGARITREEIVRNTGVSSAFLKKIIQILAQHGLVSARPGAHGGCSLAQPADRISILRVVESIDGPIRISECLRDASICSRTKACSLRSVIAQLQKQIVDVLDGTTVASMVEKHVTSPEQIVWPERSQPA